MAKLMDCQYELRDRLVSALEKDLTGPRDEGEVLQDAPFGTYIAGVLYPQDEPNVETEQLLDDDEGESEVTYADPPVALANTRYPSSLGLTFAIDNDQCRELRVFPKAARYEPSEGAWRRVPLDLAPLSIPVPKEGAADTEYPLDEDLVLFVRLRAVDVAGHRAITMVLVNKATARPGERDQWSYFQAGIEVDAFGVAVFVDRGGARALSDDDLKTYALLYRDRHTFAVGHGTSATWTADPGSARATAVATATVPRSEVPVVESNPAITSDALEMAWLAAASREEAVRGLRALPEQYAEWIEGARRRAVDFTSQDLRDTATSHLDDCESARNRIAAGIDLLGNDDVAWRAFQLMNRAMLEQRARAAWKADGRPAGGPTHSSAHAWRPFQLAFILLNLEGVSEPSSADRDIVDLLWFPTGGGKTEAYLGLIGYVILSRRLRLKDDGAGVSVLMRYTLRLLTIQQFERAASLICALEVVRRHHEPEMGRTPISIGLWVGGDGTPGTLNEARTALDDLRRNRPLQKGNPMQLQHCAWCGERLTSRDYWIGDRPRQLNITCSDDDCSFRKGLPVYVVDEDIYRIRPALVIATADKFAAMPWMREASYHLFVDPGGRQPPPELIVQDELHLISGPLGTLAGLYEGAIDLLCTDESGARPKVIASTATIRRASEQVAALFDRKMAQFPPPGIDAGDSFFATEAPRAERATRLYVGLLAPGASQSTLMIRTYAALMQAVHDDASSDACRDPYWTMVGYFNSLRVLGAARIQVNDDVQDRIEVIATDNPRDLALRIELTSRESSADIPARLEAMAVSLPDEALDCVLATNMISVGVDVDRLGLMAVMGQPQASAEYIQATSRVGRRFPGLVVTIYNGSRSRDRSHYERFTAYHESLYQQVEATSVTPFSPRARDRALHAVLVLLARARIAALRPHGGAGAVGVHRTDLEEFVEYLARRASSMPGGAGDPAEVADAVRREGRRFLDRWEARAANTPPGAGLRYVDFRNDANSLLGPADVTNGDRIPTPMSLRDVDTECTLHLI